MQAGTDGFARAYIRANSADYPYEPGGRRAVSSPPEPRKRTVFEPCERHAAAYAAETRARRAECMVEGGLAGECSPGPCRMRPGTDFYAAGFVTGHPVYYVGLS